MVEVQKPMVFWPARPSAGIGVVEVQKLKVFCDFCGARATLSGIGVVDSRFFATFLLFELVVAQTDLGELGPDWEANPDNYKTAFSQGSLVTSCRAQSLLLSPSGGLPAPRMTMFALPRTNNSSA